MSGGQGFFEEAYYQSEEFKKKSKFADEWNALLGVVRGKQLVDLHLTLDELQWLLRQTKASANYDNGWLPSTGEMQELKNIVFDTMRNGF